MICEFVLKNGISYIGEHMGIKKNSHAIKNPYKLIPVPAIDTTSDGMDVSLLYTPSLIPVVFFNTSSTIIYINEDDVLIFVTVDGLQKDKYLKLLKLYEEQ
jgi:hypothetical protein